jgi:hypothetical protein
VTEIHQDPSKDQRFEGVDDQLGTARIGHGLKECTEIAKEVVTGNQERVENRELLLLVLIPTLV